MGKFIPQGTHSVDIELTCKMVHKNYCIPIPAENRGLFPGFKTPLILIDTFGFQVNTNAGRYCGTTNKVELRQGMVKWFRNHGVPNKGMKVRLTWKCDFTYQIKIL